MWTLKVWTVGLPFPINTHLENQEYKDTCEKKPDLHELYDSSPPTIPLLNVMKSHICVWTYRTSISKWNTMSQEVEIPNKRTLSKKSLFAVNIHKFAVL